MLMKNMRRFLRLTSKKTATLHITCTLLTRCQLRSCGKDNSWPEHMSHTAHVVSLSLSLALSCCVFSGFILAFPGSWISFFISC